MKTLATTLSAFILLIGSLTAQPQDGMSKEQMDRIHSYKIGYLTTELSLTPDESERFWPIYNEFESRRRELMQSKKDLHEEYRTLEESGSLSDEKGLELLEAHKKIEKDEFELHNEYIERFNSEIGSVKTLKLIDAEHQFRKDMMRRMRKGQRGSGHPQGHWPIFEEWTNLNFSKITWRKQHPSP